MGISNFPASLQPIIQQGFLEREFEQALRGRLGYRMIADREVFAVGIGESLTKTRAGLIPAVTTPVPANANTNFDNSLITQNWGVEQYTITLNLYAATQDLNMVTSRVGIASQFLQNALTNGEQAARTLDELARNALFAPYFGGNTRVNATLTSAGPTISVDDVRGFMTVFVNGVQTAVSTTYPLAVTVGGTEYSLVAAAPTLGVTNLITGAMPGQLTFATSVAVSDGTEGNAVVAATASMIVRPSGVTTALGLAAGNTLTMSMLLDAVANLRQNAVPVIDGAYNCYLDPVSARQLFGDPDFKQLFQGATSSSPVFRQGMVNDFLGLRFVTTTDAIVQQHPTLPALFIRRPIVCGKGALIEADYAGIGADDFAPKDALVNIVDSVAMVTREPLDRLQQIIAQSWYWIGGFCAPSDTTTTPVIMPTATNANFKRAVMIEHIG